MNDLDELMLKLVMERYNLLIANKWDKSRFKYAKQMSTTDIGHAGEKFIKQLYHDIGVITNSADKDEHNEFDVKLVKLNKKIEVKTATEGRTKTTFQFNGIDPRHNSEFYVLIGISIDGIYFNHFSKEDLKWDHKKKRWFVHNIEQCGDKPRQLVSMTPNDPYNFKLTLDRKDLYKIDEKNLYEYLKSTANIK